MKVLITGAGGFVGRNLTAQLHNIKAGKARNYSLPDDLTIYEYDIDTNPELDVYKRQRLYRDGCSL